MRPNTVPTYQAIYRLAARPYALSRVAAGVERIQLATIYHAAGATKDVRIRTVEVAVESASAAGILTLDFVRLTAAVTPATGNPAITPAPIDPADAAAEATCLALPTTGGTEGVLLGSEEWNLGITGAATTANPPPPLTYQTLFADPGGEMKTARMRAATAEGFAVVADASAAFTHKSFVIITFTEE